MVASEMCLCMFTNIFPGFRKEKKEINNNYFFKKGSETSEGTTKEVRQGISPYTDILLSVCSKYSSENVQHPIQHH